MHTAIRAAYVPVALAAARPVYRKFKTTMSSPNTKIGGVPTLKYFDLGKLGGRGGVLRYFLLAHGIDFKDDVIQKADWNGVKAELVASGDNPAGHVPVLYLGDRKLTEHVAIMRLLSRRLGLYGADEDADYLADSIADEYTTWRAAWAGTLGSEEKRAEYPASRERWYGVMESLLGRGGGAGPYLAGGTPGLADVALFGLMRDDQLLFGEAPWGECPRLRGLFEAAMAIEPIKEWVASKGDARGFLV